MMVSAACPDIASASAPGAAAGTAVPSLLAAAEPRRSSGASWACLDAGSRAQIFQRLSEPDQARALGVARAWRADIAALAEQATLADAVGPDPQLAARRQSLERRARLPPAAPHWRREDHALVAVLACFGAFFGVAVALDYVRRCGLAVRAVPEPDGTCGAVDACVAALAGAAGVGMAGALTCLLLGRGGVLAHRRLFCFDRSYPRLRRTDVDASSAGGRLYYRALQARPAAPDGTPPV